MVIMSYLPSDVVILVLQRLPSIEDRKAASLVCKSWYEAYQSPFFRRKEVLVISVEESFNELAKLENPNRVFANVLVRRVDIKKKSKGFWERFGKDIKSLSIESCTFQEKDFVNVITRCGELESLGIENCEELLTSGSLLEKEKERVAIHRKLLNLKSLNLGYNRCLSDAVFVRFASLCLKPEELLLTGCRCISFHPGVYRKFYKKDHSNPSENVFTFPVIYDFIRENAEYLKSLSFSKTLIDDSSLRRISETEGLALEKLYMLGCTEITNNAIIHLSDYQIGLTHLDMSFSYNLNDISLLAICSRLNGLRHLSICGCRAITDSGLSDLWRLTRLEHLDMSMCKSIKDQALIVGLCRRENKNLKVLRLNYLNLTEKSVIAVAETLPGLEVLSLSYCRKAVTDKTVKFILTKLVGLRCLHLSMCQDLTDVGLTGVDWEPPPDAPPENCPKIPLGSKAEQKIISDAKLKEAIHSYSETMKTGLDSGRISIGHLKKLQCLYLSGCHNITDVSLIHAFKFDDLRYLDLSNCTEITSPGLEVLLECNRSIENLNLDHCNGIDDDGVDYIFKNLKRLKSLTLGSTAITDRILEFLPKYEMVNLRFFDIRHCSQLSLLAVTRIIARYPQVEVQHLAAKTNDCHCETLQIPPPPPPPPPPPKSFLF